MDRRMLLGGLSATALAPGFAFGQATNEIRIGAPLPLTGPLAPEGRKQKRGYDLWAAQVTKDGGVDVGGRKLPVRIIYSDYQSATPRGVQACEFLVNQEKAHFLFSPFGSGAAKAGSAIAERYKIPMIAPTASSVEVYDQGFKYLFGTFTPNSTLTEPLAKLVTEKAPDVKKVAIFSRNDLLPLSLANEMRKSSAARNLSVVYDEKFAIGTLDFAAALTQMRAAAPDWVFVGGYINDLVQVRSQMRDLGMKPKVLTMIAGPAYEEYIQALKGAAENVSSAAWWHPSVRYEGEDLFRSTANYVEVFKAAYNGDTPDYAEASASSAGAILQLALKKAGTLEGPAVRDALASLNVRTFWGPVHFGATGQIDSLTPPVFQIQEGKAVVLVPDEIKRGEFRFGIA
ncbi:MAG: amino acid ABC transporter substrate-binding protein [Proteobacteria bacterium]|nr:amino acid ABC transporter substrate-binding protein [Pseudomonadota bacterium]